MLKCIKKCETNKNLILFKFPKNYEFLLSIWVNNLQLEEDFKPNSMDRVCSLHFSADCIGLRRSKKGTVPLAFGGK